LKDNISIATIKRPNIHKIGLVCPNCTIRFAKPEHPVFIDKPYVMNLINLLNDSKRYCNKGF
jgi:hypothetical protein